MGETAPRLRYDHEVDAVSIRLRNLPQAFTDALDYQRIIDYAEDGTPIGIELLNVSCGVSLDNVPDAETVERLLRDHGIPVLKKVG